MKNEETRGNELESEYIPTAVYYADADTVEYVRRDVPCVYRRIDGILTLALDLHTREITGFRLKGFKNFFINHLKPKYKLIDGDFIPLVSVIEQALQIVGDKVCIDEAGVEAYRCARRMAHEDRVAIEPLAA
jgi:hypothetical protein